MELLAWSGGRGERGGEPGALPRGRLEGELPAEAAGRRSAERSGGRRRGEGSGDRGETTLQANIADNLIFSSYIKAVGDLTKVAVLTDYDYVSYMESFTYAVIWKGPLSEGTFFYHESFRLKITIPD